MSGGEQDDARTAGGSLAALRLGTAATTLARAVALADLRATRSGLGPIARWRVGRLLKAAADELGLQLPGDAEPHVTDRDPVGATVSLLQTAWLRLHGVVVQPSLEIRRATHERYWVEHERRARTPRVPRRALALMTVAVVAVGGGIGFALSASASDVEAAPALGPRTLLPAEREATWVEALTDWVVSLDRLARARYEGELPTRIDEREESLARHRVDVLAEDLREPLGEQALEALAAMLDGAEAATRAGSGWAAREEAFAEAVRAANRVLAVRGYGYFFDSYAVSYDDGHAEAAFYTFRIAASRRFTADGEPVSALHLRRLDRLNIVQSLLGYTSKRMDVAVLLVDKLEGEIATRLGPALEPGREMTLRMDDEDEGKDSWLAVRKKAGQVVREAFYGALPGEQQALSELGELLARRSDLVIDWNSRLAERNISLRDFETLEVTSAYRDRFESLTSIEARRVLDDIQRELAKEGRPELFERLVTRHARPVELHEVQHRIDYAAGDDFEVPDVLLAMLQIQPGSEHADSEDVRRIAYELSAYTAEIARDADWARVNLTLLTEHLYDGSGGAEGWSAVLILEGLARNIGLRFEPIIDPEGRRAGAELETVAALHLQLLGEPGPRLASAAQALWQTWFGHPLARLEAL